MNKYFLHIDHFNIRVCVGDLVDLKLAEEENICSLKMIKHYSKNSNK